MDQMSKPVQVKGDSTEADSSILSILKTDLDSNALEAGMPKFKLFGDVKEEAEEYMYTSPVKSPVKKVIANPEYRPFNENGSELSSSNSDQFSEKSPVKSHKSEDDSPHRRKLIRSPKKRATDLFMSELNSQNRIQKLLQESD